MKKIQRVELNKFYNHSIFCPFCGKKVVDMEAANENREEGMVNPCLHTLFMAHDEGFEYRSERFDSDRGITGITDDDVELPEQGYDGLTDQVTIADSVKFASYVGMPSGFGSYVGFAPVDSE